MKVYAWKIRLISHLSSCSIRYKAMQKLAQSEKITLYIFQFNSIMNLRTNLPAMRLKFFQFQIFLQIQEL